MASADSCCGSVHVLIKNASVIEILTMVDFTEATIFYRNFFFLTRTLWFER